MINLKALPWMKSSEKAKKALTKRILCSSHSGKFWIETVDGLSLLVVGWRGRSRWTVPKFAMTVQSA